VPPLFVPVRSRSFPASHSAGGRSYHSPPSIFVLPPSLVINTECASDREQRLAGQLESGPWTLCLPPLSFFFSTLGELSDIRPGWANPRLLAPSTLSLLPLGPSYVDAMVSADRPTIGLAGTAILPLASGFPFSLFMRLIPFVGQWSRVTNGQQCTQGSVAGRWSFQLCKHFPP